MQRLSVPGIFVLIAIIMASCNSGGGKDRVKEPESVVAQEVKNDTLITVYEGVSPCKGCKAINTQIAFVRSLKDTVGRFHLQESYINKKDSVFQHYEGGGNYKIIPAANGGTKGVALYNMVVDDQTRKEIYLLEDSVTLVKADDNGKPVTGENAVTLKKSK